MRVSEDFLESFRIFFWRQLLARYLTKYRQKCPELGQLTVCLDAAATPQGRGVAARGEAVRKDRAASAWLTPVCFTIPQQKQWGTTGAPFRSESPSDHVSHPPALLLTRQIFLASLFSLARSLPHRTITLAANKVHNYTQTWIRMLV